MAEKEFVFAPTWLLTTMLGLICVFSFLVVAAVVFLIVYLRRNKRRDDWRPREEEIRIQK